MEGSCSRRRRWFLLAAGAALSGTAGCSRRDETTATHTAMVTATETTRKSTATTTADGPGSDLDLREANVVDVAFEPTGEGVYRFDVTLFHDDEGEDGYADWWQVERLDGTRLGRRELLHAHGTAPFTRSAEIEIPAAVSCVVVRGHDKTHGYGGQAYLVTLETGTARSARQGSEPETFDSGDCP
jgi:hypothetical protein